MPAGLEIVGTHGVVIIDENWRNYHLVASGSATLDNAAPVIVHAGAIGKFHRVADAAITTASIVVLRGTGGAWCTLLSQAAGEFVAFGTSDGTFDWWVFDLVSTPSGAAYGLEVYNAAGTLVFDSGRAPMRPTANVSVPSWGGPGAPPISVPDGTSLTISAPTVPSGRTWGWAVGANAHVMWSGGGGGPGSTGNEMEIAVFTGGASGGGIFAKTAQVATVLGGANFYQGNPGWMLLVDVTNL